jgi:hypothetical protein
VTSPLLDTAIRADSTSTPNPASDSGTWTVVDGTFGISSNTIYRPSSGGTSYPGGFDAIWRDLGSASQDVQVDANRTSASGDGMIGLAGDSTGAHYQLRYDSSGDHVVERITSAGSVGETVIANANLAGFSGSTTTLRVTYDSTTGVINVYQGGSLKATGTASTLLTGTRVVLGSKATSGTADHWSNFSAYTLGTRPSAPAPRPKTIFTRRIVPIARASVI